MVFPSRLHSFFSIFFGMSTLRYYIYTYLNITWFSIRGPMKKCIAIRVYVMSNGKIYKSMELEMTKSVLNTYDTWNMTSWSGSVVAIFRELHPCAFVIIEFSSVNIVVSILNLILFWMYVYWVEWMRLSQDSAQKISGIQLKFDTHDHHVLTRSHCWDTFCKSSCQWFWQSIFSKNK